MTALAHPPVNPGVDGATDPRDPEVRLRAYAVTRRGQGGWPPLRAVTDRLVTG